MKQAKLLIGCLLITVTAPAIELTSAGPLRARILLLDEHNDGTRSTREVSDRRTFYDGERIRLSVQSERSGYVYVLCHTSQGEARLLYPSTGGSSFLRAGEATSLPGGGWFRFDSDPGTERLLLIWSRGRLRELERSDMESGSIPMNLLRQFASQSEGEQEFATKGIRVENGEVRSVRQIRLRHESRDSGNDRF